MISPQLLMLRLISPPNMSALTHISAAVVALMYVFDAGRGRPGLALRGKPILPGGSQVCLAGRFQASGTHLLLPVTYPARNPEFLA
jgi:hypothetical protein